MEQYLVAIISTAVGSLITLIGIALNNRYLIKLERERFHHEKSIQKEISHNEFEEKKFFDSLVNIKQAHYLLSEIRNDVRLETSVIDSESKRKPNEFNEFYRTSISKNLQELESIINVYVPHLRSEVYQLRGTASNFWGNQKLLLNLDIEKIDEADSYKSMQKIVIGISNETWKIIDSMGKDLIEQTKRTSKIY